MIESHHQFCLKPKNGQKIAVSKQKYQLSLRKLCANGGKMEYYRPYHRGTHHIFLLNGLLISWNNAQINHVFNLSGRHRINRLSWIKCFMHFIMWREIDLICVWNGTIIMPIKRITHIKLSWINDFSCST